MSDASANGSHRGSETEATPPSDGPPASRTAAGASAGHEGREPTGSRVLGMVFPTAALAIVGMLFGRAIAPSLAGLTTGLDRMIRKVDLAAGVVTQILAMIATVVAIAHILVAVRSKLPAWLRLAQVSLGGFVVLVTLSAAGPVRVAAMTSGLIGLAAAALALSAAVVAHRSPLARPAARVVGFAAVGAMLRLLAIVIALKALAPASAKLGPIARGIATAGFAFDAAALAMAMTWLGARTKKLWSPASVLVLALAFVATRVALGADHDDAGAVTVLVRRVAERLSARPEPFGPVALRVFVTFLAPLLAVAAVVLRGPIPALAGAVALALLARGAPEVPLCALFLLIAGVALALAGHDERAIWRALDDDGEKSKLVRPP